MLGVTEDLNWIGPVNSEKIVCDRRKDRPKDGIPFFDREVRNHKKYP